MVYVFIFICLVAVTGVFYVVLKKDPKVVEELETAVKNSMEKHLPDMVKNVSNEAPTISGMMKKGK